MIVMMGCSSPRAYHPNGVTLFLFLITITISFLMFPSKSEGSLMLWNSSDLGVMKVRVGSRPPRCVNKCLTCRPCTATLVISQHHNHNNQDQMDHNYKAKSREESYYLLSWKCKCGDKLFQP